MCALHRKFSVVSALCSLFSTRTFAVDRKTIPGTPHAADVRASWRNCTIASIVWHEMSSGWGGLSFLVQLTNSVHSDALHHANIAPVVHYTMRALHQSCITPCAHCACRALHRARAHCTCRVLHRARTAPVAHYTMRALHVSCITPCANCTCRALHYAHTAPVVHYTMRTLHLSCITPCSRCTCRALRHAHAETRVFDITKCEVFPLRFSGIIFIFIIKLRSDFRSLMTLCTHVHIYLFIICFLQNDRFYHFICHFSDRQWFPHQWWFVNLGCHCCFHYSPMLVLKLHSSVIAVS